MNRDTNMATAWTKHKAIVNYENFHGINVDLKSNLIDTDVHKIANTALGIDCWALYDVGSLEEAAVQHPVYRRVGSSRRMASSSAVWRLVQVPYPYV